MTDEIEVYWKDLKIGIKKELMKWYKENGFEGLEPLFNNDLPFITITKDLYDSSELIDSSAMDGMVS